MIVSSSRSASQILLSSKEILDISQEINSKYAPITSIKPAGRQAKMAFSSRELFDISAEITRKHTPKINYGIPKLVLLPIDPEHLYAYWNLGDDQTNPASKDESQDIVLRIYPKQDDIPAKPQKKVWFDVVIDQAQRRQTVFVPKEHNAESYTAVIGTLAQDNHLTELVTSKAAQKPWGVFDSYPACDNGMPPNSVPSTSSSHKKKPPVTSNNASGQSNK
jgi:Domain of unknown function (DUF4912)